MDQARKFAFRRAIGLPKYKKPRCSGLCAITAAEIDIA